MKKIIISSLALSLVGGIIFISCTKKNDKDAFAPTYKASDPKGTGGNPYITYVTTTGTTAGNNGTNSDLPNVGSTTDDWFTNCGGTSLTVVKGSSKVVISFLSAPVSGTYTFVKTGPGATDAVMTVTSPAGQAPGTSWVAVDGSVSVVVTAGKAVATFNNINCKQNGTGTTIVKASGVISCN